MRFPFTVLLAVSTGFASQEAAPEPTAQEFMKAVSDKYLASKSLVTKVDVTMALKEMQGSITMELRTRGDACYWHAGNGTFGDEPFQMSAICDGKTVWVRSSLEKGRPASRRKAPAGAAIARIRALVLSGGNPLADAGAPVKVGPGDFAYEPDERIDDRVVRVLRAKTSEGTFTIWIDAESLAFMKSEWLSRRKESVKVVVRETRFDTDIKDEQFLIPE